MKHYKDDDLIVIEATDDPGTITHGDADYIVSWSPDPDVGWGWRLSWDEGKGDHLLGRLGGPHDYDGAAGAAREHLERLKRWAAEEASPDELAQRRDR